MDLDGLGCRTAVNSGKSREGEKGKLVLHIPVESVVVECYSHLLLDCGDTRGSSKSTERCVVLQRHSGFGSKRFNQRPSSVL